MTPFFSIRNTYKALLSIGLLLVLMVGSWQQAQSSVSHSRSYGTSWIADEPAAEEILLLADNEAVMHRHSHTQRLRLASVKERVAPSREAYTAPENSGKDFAATLATYAQQYGRHIPLPGYYLFLFRYNLF